MDVSQLRTIIHVAERGSLSKALDRLHIAQPALSRDAVAKLCALFPREYLRTLDREMADPTEFVNALTEVGWLSARITNEFGGAGLSKHIFGLPRLC